jgi:hypothetical protein
MDTLERLDEMTVVGPVGNGLYGVTMLDGSTIAVNRMHPAQEKQLLRFSLDPGPLTERGLERITRGFTDAECLTHSIDSCPTTVRI